MTRNDVHRQATAIYASFNDSERFGVKFAMFPFDKMPTDSEDSHAIVCEIMRLASEAGYE